METQTLLDEDRELIEAARRAVIEASTVGAVGSALRLGDGRVVTANNAEADVGVVGVCAERVAMTGALAAGEERFEAIVAVLGDPAKRPEQFPVIPPCGVCRELLSDYAPNLRVILRLGGELRRVRAIDLLPGKSDWLDVDPNPFRPFRRRDTKASES